MIYSDIYCLFDQEKCFLQLLHRISVLTDGQKKSRILTPINLENNDKFSWVWKILCVFKKVCCVCVKLIQKNKYAINLTLKDKNLDKVKLWSRQYWAHPVPTDFLHHSLIRRLHFSSI